MNRRPRSAASHRLRAAALSALLALTGPTAAAAGDRLDTFLDGLSTLQANFRQVLMDENRESLEESEGIVYLQRPDRFRWDYTAPYPQQIVADGERVWMYEPELRQATVRPQDNLIGATPAALLSTTEPVSKRFLVEDRGVAEDGRSWLELRPRDSSASFVAIRLGFAGDALAVMELEDSFGQTTRLEFAQMQRNPSLDGGLFAFTPPAGTDVIQDR
jgi:outer membrane lipoprotein carrier protein